MHILLDVLQPTCCGRVRVQGACILHSAGREKLIACRRFLDGSLIVCDVAGDSRQA